MVKVGRVAADAKPDRRASCDNGSVSCGTGLGVVVAGEVGGGDGGLRGQRLEVVGLADVLPGGGVGGADKKIGEGVYRIGAHC